MRGQKRVESRVDALITRASIFFVRNLYEDNGLPSQARSRATRRWRPGIVLHPSRKCRMRHGRQEIAGVLRLRRAENLCGRPLLDNAAGAHDDDAVAQEPHY